MSALRLQDSIEAVPGVGPARARELHRARLYTVEDLLLYLPLRYEDRSRVLAIADLQPGEAATIVGRVESCRRRPGGGRRARVDARIADDSGTLAVVWFNQAYVAEQLRSANRVMLYGRPALFRERVQLVNPVLATLDDGAGEAPLHVGRPVPVYRRLGKLGTGAIRRLVSAALDALEPVEEGLPPRVVAEHGLLARGEAVARVHRPPQGEPLRAYDERRSPAHRRLILQEFIDFQAALALQRQRAAAEPGRVIAVADAQLHRVRGHLPFALTAAQERALAAIVADMAAPRAMHRLLQGDVGCGKTAVAGCALLATALDGKQAALLAPTEILAQQQAASLRSWASAVGVQVASLTGATRAAARRGILENVESGAVGVLVGTHALLQSTVHFADLALVVIDEQHRFGVEQRAALRAKGRQGGVHPDLLVMTATPIPRSLALTLYGDLDVTIIDELPPGRAPIATAVRGAREWPTIRESIRAAVAAGEQAFVVSPRIGEEDDAELRSAAAVHAELAATLPEVEFGLLHGDLAAERKAHVMERFAAGECPVLVATTVVEVGVDVPAASLMVIEHAERLGLAQLHQLRGRVGRGQSQGQCWLVAHEPLSATARARLRTLCETTDGFAIAEEDLRLRGPGELLGARQAGAFGLRLGDPFEHPDWLATARDVAAQLIEQEDQHARAYRKHLQQAWRQRSRLARAG